MKINKLFQQLPRKVVVTAQWLKAQGISSKLAWWYVQSGWLERVADGAYKFAGDDVSWVGTLNALQQQLDLAVHVGGKTALQLLGHAHYLAVGFNKQPMQLFAPEKLKLPRWFTRTELWEVDFHLLTTKLFTSLEDEHDDIVTREYEGLELRLAGPERAALELCYLVPKLVSFHEAAELIELLSRLRPKHVENLLIACGSIKAKRLFLYLAEHYQHEWLSAIDMNKINLGKGKRVVAEGGVYDAKYQLSLPKLNRGG